MCRFRPEFRNQNIEILNNAVGYRLLVRTSINSSREGVQEVPTEFTELRLDFHRDLERVERLEYVLHRLQALDNTNDFHEGSP